MEQSPHRRKKTPRANGDLWLPIGKKAGVSFKPAGYGSPGKEFKDAQGKKHTIPDKRKSKAARKERQRGR